MNYLHDSDFSEWRECPEEFALIGMTKDEFDVEDVLVENVVHQEAIAFDDRSEFRRVVLAMREAGVVYIPASKSLLGNYEARDYIPE